MFARLIPRRNFCTLATGPTRIVLNNYIFIVLLHNGVPAREAFAMLVRACGAVLTLARFNPSLQRPAMTDRHGNLVSDWLGLQAPVRPCIRLDTSPAPGIYAGSAAFRRTSHCRRPLACALQSLTSQAEYEDV